MTFKFLLSGPAHPTARFICAHGAGAGMATPFMETMASQLAERGIATLRFEFAYMAARQGGGARRPPPKAERLMDEYREAARGAASGVPMLIGGKSMGGRVASLVADELFEQGLVAGLVCLGYPFHPPKKPDQLRTAHLLNLACPTLIVQGDRDPFGSRQEVEALRLSSLVRFHWAGDGDHDLGPRGASGFTRKGNLALAADAITAFAAQIIARR